MKTSLIYPDPCVCGHEPQCYEVWTKDESGYDLMEFLPSDSPEVFAAACFSV